MESVGTLLWQMRTTRGWTLGKLAQKAGISKAALSQWESGKRQPRVVELEAVLEALNLSAAQRALVFARIEAPRAIRHLRRQVAAVNLIAPPTVGDLLRAMRLRKRWSQERLAMSVGVDRSSVVRWERSERLPDSEDLHKLCYALEAYEEELLTLAQGHFSASPHVSSANREEQERLLGERMDSLLWSGGDILELRWLVLEHDTWQMALRHEASRPLLTQVLVGHAWRYRNLEHWGEVKEKLQRALVLSPPEEVASGTRLRTVLMHAALLVYGGSRPGPERGLQELQRWLAHSTDPKYTAWMLADMAKYAALANRREASLALAAQACRTAERSGSLTEVHLRSCDYGSLLLEAGHPEEALQVLPPAEPNSLWAQIHILLLMAEAHQKRGHLSEAHDLLQQACNLIASHREMEVWRPKADLLAQRF